MSKAPSAFLVLLLPAFASSASPAVVVSSERVRLGISKAPEWEWFADDPPRGERLDIPFHAEPSTGEATLFIRQDDVKQEWIVQLNGRRLGKLFLMEADLVHSIAVPAGVLRSGENVLSVLSALPDSNDDIVLHEIRLDPRPLAAALGGATLAVSVSDKQANPLPCRITVTDERGALAAIIPAAGGDSGPGNTLAVRPGVAYAGGGKARLGLLAGRYTVSASRGFEYGVISQQVEIADGQTRELALELAREVETAGWVSCDTHVHTFTHSRHGDATLEERMVTLAGEGVELPIATDHNLHADYREAARGTGMSRWFTPVIGNEVTTDKGHFNIFPVHPDAPVVDARITDWPQLMTAIRATPGIRVVVLNHPRSIHSRFRPFDSANFNAATGENKLGPAFSFDALEVLNSGAQQSDYLLVYRDWFALLNYGYRITAVGASDSHDVSRFIVGQGRTYVALAQDENASTLDIAAACEGLLKGRALVSMGLLAEMTVEEKFRVGDLATPLPEQVRVNVRVSGPSWVKAARVELYANGVKIREAAIGAGGDEQDRSGAAGEKVRRTWTIPRPKHDVHLVAIATGPPVIAPFWAMTRPYQPASPRWEGRAIGSTNPIWLDADGDGRFSPAREYAQSLVKQYGTAPARLFPALGNYDEAVAAQAASLCAASGEALHSPGVSEALKGSAPQVAAGFAKYLAGAAGTAGAK